MPANSVVLKQYGSRGECPMMSSKTTPGLVGEWGVAEFIGKLNELFIPYPNLSELLNRAANTILELVSAEACAIIWKNEDKQHLYIRALSKNGRQHHISEVEFLQTQAKRFFDDASLSVLQLRWGMKKLLGTPIKMNQKLVGSIFLFYPLFRYPITKEEDHAILTQFAACLGRAVEFQSQRNLLASRYATMALSRDIDHEKQIGNSLESHTLAAVRNPEKVAKIIARAFYKDLRKAGFETKQILVVATELIENLNKALKNTKAKTNNL